MSSPSQPGGIRTVPGARFTCQRTGFCCRFHQLGPVEADRLQALIDSDPPSWWPPAAAGPWNRTTMGPRGMVTELARVDGHCVFLGDDQRCGIYTHLGGDARPGFCRLFPFHVVDDPGGVSVTVRESCAGRLATQDHGQPVADQAAAAVALARAGGVVHRATAADVQVLPGWTVPAATWRKWTDRLVEDLSTGGGAAGLVASGLVAGVRDRLAAWAGVELPTPDPARGILALRAVLAALDLTLQQVIAAGGAPSDAEATFVSDQHAAIQAAAAALASGQRAAPPEGADAYLSRQLADLLLGQQLSRSGDVAAGLGRFLALATVATHAAGTQPGKGGLDRLSLAHSHLARLSHNQALRAVLARATPALHDAFLHATA